MQRLVLLCLGLVCAASAQSIVDPRGARPVEHGTRADKCATQKEWPFCSDDDWGSKCPSGCRIQGLLDKFDHGALKKIEKIRSLLDENRAKHRSADQVSKQTYDYLKEKLVVDSGHDTNYYDLAQSLRQRITDMKIKIDRQLRILAALKDRVKDQVVDMQRLEVDIDIKLRSCKGSCQSYTEYQVDHESYVALEKQVSQLDSQAAQNIESVGTLYVMKSRPLQDALVDSIYKSKDVAAQQREDMFPGVNTLQLVLEQEGSSSSPATISKVPGTSFSPSTSSSSSTSTTFSGSSGTSSSSKSITELGGTGDGGSFGTGGGFSGFSQPTTTHVSTQSISCTKSVRRTVVHTKDGPVEKTEEVWEGGPECQAMGDPSNTDLSSFFPSLSHTSSSSSSSSSVSRVYSGGSKGSLLGDAKSGFGNPFDTTGLDLGGFLTDNAEDDVPDFHARSVKSARVERQADYIGQVCVRLKQPIQDGRPPPHRKQRCRAKSDVPLCSDDDWVSRCPSGCRIQGLISQMETEVDRKLKKVCKTGKMYEDLVEKTMETMVHIYNYNRRIVVHQYVSELKFVEKAEGLARNLTSLRKRSSMLSLQLDELRQKVQKQIVDLYRTEVDVDMKLRSCHGSCRSVLPFGLDHPSYQALQTDVDRMDKTRAQRRTTVPPAEDVPDIRLQAIDISPTPSPEYKTIATVRRELLTQFEDIGQNQVVLEELLED